MAFGGIESGSNYTPSMISTITETLWILYVDYWDVSELAGEASTSVGSLIPLASGTSSQKHMYDAAALNPKLYLTSKVSRDRRLMCIYNSAHAVDFLLLRSRTFKFSGASSEVHFRLRVFGD